MWEIQPQRACGMGSPFSLSHTHIYNESGEQCGPACCNCGVLGGGDQEVNMIQSSSFISLMKVITAYWDSEAARLAKTNHLLQACNAPKPTWAE